MIKQGAQLVHISTFFPENTKVATEADYQAEEFFKVPKKRHFAFPTYLAGDLGARALQNLIKETHIDPHQIDLILYSCAIPDYINIPIGPEIQYKGGAFHARVLSVDTGCVSFISMLQLADELLQLNIYKNIVMITVTNFVSRLKDFQKNSKSFVLGDGATATLVTKGNSCLLSVTQKSHGEHYGLMTCKPLSKEGEAERYYWDNEHGPLEVQFTESMLNQLKKNAIQLVTDRVNEAIVQSGYTKEQMSWLLTHQPNLGLINKWRENIGILPPKTFDTFHLYGNLFQGSLPATLSTAIHKNQFKKDDLIAMGTFANGGDFSGACVLKWPL